MIWKMCRLKKRADGTKDALGNLVGGAWETVAEKRCRYTPWTNEQIAVEDQKVTRNEQQFIFPVPVARFPACTHAEIDGGPLHEITMVSELSPRWTLIRVKAYKE